MLQFRDLKFSRSLGGIRPGGSAAIRAMGFSQLVPTMLKSSNMLKATFVFVYYFIACVFFKALEGWPIYKTIYFTTVTITTVGYGDFSPVTTGGRVFGVFFILIGIGGVFSIILGVAN